MSATTPMTIDLRSDFLARRSPPMEEAWARAQDEPYHFGLREDPHQQTLERRLAELLGHEDALVFPTCTMANLTGVMLSAPPGTRVVTPRDAHVLLSEAGGAAGVAGVQPVAIDADPMAEDAEPWRAAAAQPRGDAQRPATSLFVLENTHNRASGWPLSPSFTHAVTQAARASGIRTHLDGARVFAAAAALGCGVDELARDFDTVAVSLNKGFGAPIAAALAGSHDTIERALTIRQRLGGGIRPTGPAAAATLAALDDTSPFATANTLARRLADGLAAVEGLRVDVDRVRTNIVVVDVTRPAWTAEIAQARLAARGVLAIAFGATRLRMVTYRGITEHHVDAAVAIAADVMRGPDQQERTE